MAQLQQLLSSPPPPQQTLPPNWANAAAPGRTSASVLGGATETEGMIVALLHELRQQLQDKVGGCWAAPGRECC